MRDLVIREAAAADVVAIAAIYGAAVLRGTGSFEVDPPSLAEMDRRRARLVEAGYPYLVAATPSALAGFAYAGPFRDRPAYRFTIEDSVYVDEASRGRGVGRALLDALVASSVHAGFRQMLALVGDSANAGSIGLHAACGFRHVGTMAATGFKQGRWLDVVVMQRVLGDGGAASPASPA